MNPATKRCGPALFLTTIGLVCAFTFGPASRGQDPDSRERSGDAALRKAVASSRGAPQSRARESRPDPTPALQRIEWISRHQSPDGRWSGSDFVTLCDTRSGRCGDAGGPGYDVGLTGLVAYAMLSAGYDSRRSGPYQESLIEALRYLEGVQDSRGRFGDPASPHFAWSHALATVAMRAEYAMSRDERWGRSARAGVKALCDPDAAQWPWQAANVTNEAVYAAAWGLHALAVPDDPIGFDRKAAIKAATRYLNDFADRTERPFPIGADSRSAADRPETRPSLTVADCALAATFVARAERAFLPKDEDPPRTRRMLELLRSLDRSLLPLTQSDDLHAALFVTKAALLASAVEPGGATGKELWKRWSENIRKVMLASQIPEGCAEGSWTPSDGWTRASGRVCSTALSTLVLITSYQRFLTFR